MRKTMLPIPLLKRTRHIVVPTLKMQLAFSSKLFPYSLARETFAGRQGINLIWRSYMRNQAMLERQWMHLTRQLSGLPVIRPMRLDFWESSDNSLANKARLKMADLAALAGQYTRAIDAYE